MSQKSKGGCGDEVMDMWLRAPDVFSDIVTYEEGVGEDWDLADRIEQAENMKDGKNQPSDDEDLEEVHQAPAKARRKTHRGTRGKKRPSLPDHPIVDIDPMEEKGVNIIGTFRTVVARQNCKEIGLLFLAGLLTILLSDTVFTQRCVVPGTQSRQGSAPSSRMAVTNIRELLGVGYLALLTQFPVRWANIFSLRKSNGKARVLLDGRNGNDCLVPPPYFTFFSPHQVVRRLQALGTFVAFTVDIRHHFHRIGINSEFGRFYAVRKGNEWYRPTVLPMGSRHGPSLAQTTALAIIAFRLRVNAEGIIDPEGKLESDLGLRLPEDTLPSVIDIVDPSGLCGPDGLPLVVGHIFICIDNIAVVTTTDELTQLWRQRLDRNACELGVAPWKEFAVWSEAKFEFIGLKYVNGDWQHCTDRVERWRSTYGESFVRRTALDIQRQVGVLVWDCRLRAKHMSHLREVFVIQAAALRGKIPTEQQWGVLDTFWSELLRNPLRLAGEEIWPPVRRQGEDTVYLCTDASETAWSWLEMKNGKVVRLPDGSNPHGKFPVEIDGLKIFYKELYATLLALRELSGRHRGSTVVIVGDNRGVIGAINKMMGPEAAWPMLDEIRKIVLENEWVPILKWVESEGNVAHSWTHEEELENVREERTWALAISETYIPLEKTAIEKGVETKKRVRNV